MRKLLILIILGMTISPLFAYYIYDAGLLNLTTEGASESGSNFVLACKIFELQSNSEIEGETWVSGNIGRHSLTIVKDGTTSNNKLHLEGCPYLLDDSNQCLCNGLVYDIFYRVRAYSNNWSSNSTLYTGYLSESSSIYTNGTYAYFVLEMYLGVKGPYKEGCYYYLKGDPLWFRFVVSNGRYNYYLNAYVVTNMVFNNSEDSFGTIKSVNIGGNAEHIYSTVTSEFREDYLNRNSTVVDKIALRKSEMTSGTHLADLAIEFTTSNENAPTGLIFDLTNNPVSVSFRSKNGYRLIGKYNSLDYLMKIDEYDTSNSKTGNSTDFTDVDKSFVIDGEVGLNSSYGYKIYIKAKNMADLESLSADTYSDILTCTVESKN